MSEFLEEQHRRRTRGSGKDDRLPPLGWSQFRQGIRYRWAVPFVCIDWLAEWAAYALSRLSILELLESCSSFTLLVGLIFYFAETPERTKLRHYQAWQVINTAQGKGGNGGRIDALRELNEDDVPLVGVDLSESFLQGVLLKHADFRRADFHAADLRGADLSQASLQLTSFVSANLRNSILASADLTDANFSDADLNGTHIEQANIHGVNFSRADLRGVDLNGIRDWQSANFQLADIHDIHNAPDGFTKWALANGAVDIADDANWNSALNPPATTQPATRN